MATWKSEQPVGIFIKSLKMSIKVILVLFLVLAEALRVKQGGDPVDTMLQVFGTDFSTKDGSCVRDYIHVSDLCSAHLRAAERLLAGNAQGAEFYNLANGNGFSVLEVIHACRKVTGQEIKYHVLPRRAGDSAVLVGDTRRAVEVLGWQPMVTDLLDAVETAWTWIALNVNKRCPQNQISKAD